MGIRLTFSPKISFEGMVGGSRKDRLINGSRGLIFPVLWHEPFGLAITESLFYGCPVFATPYGSLPELINKEVGFLSNNSTDLATAAAEAESYSAKICHEYAVENFNSQIMAKEYLKKYDTVLNGKELNAQPPVLKKIAETKFLPWQ